MENNTQEVNINPQPQQPVAKKNINPFLVLCIVLLFIIAIGVSYYVGTLKNPAIPQPSIIPNTVAVPTQTFETPSIIPTEVFNQSLRKVTSDDGYSLSYPSNLFVQLICPDGEGNFVYLIQRQKEKEDVIQMPTCGRDSRFDIELKKVPKEAALEPTTNEYYTVEKSKITVDGIDGYQYISVKNPQKLELPGPQWSKQIYIASTNYVYQFYVGNKNIDPVFQQILSTLKFTK